MIQHNPLFKRYYRLKRSHRVNTKQHRAGIASGASGQCEVIAKCERTFELPPNADMRAPRSPWGRRKEQTKMS